MHPHMTCFSQVEHLPASYDQGRIAYEYHLQLHSSGSDHTSYPISQLLRHTREYRSTSTQMLKPRPNIALHFNYVKYVLDLDTEKGK